MTTRGRIKTGVLILALLLVGSAALLESGALVPWMAVPSGWEPEPMPGLEMECGSETAPIPWTYCVHRSPGSASRDLVVHFHGRRGTARWWNDRTYYTASLYEHWENASTDPPTVVSISFGPLWVLIEDHAEALGPVLDRATEHASRWANRAFERTMVVGESMGGYNALLAGLEVPDRIDKVAALCPPLSATSPFGGGALDRLGQSSLREGFMLLVFSRAFFDDDAHWHQHDPVARVLGGQDFEPALYLSCGTRDPWGCVTGARALTESVQRQGRAPELNLLDEGHCAIDEARLAAFLTE